MAYASDRTSLDLTSRLLSIFSVIIALGVATFVFTRVGSQPNELSEEQLSALKAEVDRDLKQQITEYQAAREALAERYNEVITRQDATIREWDSELTASLNVFAADAKTLLDQAREDEAAEAESRRLAFRLALDGIEERLAAASPSTTDDGDDESLLNGPANGATGAIAGTDDEDADGSNAGATDPADEAPEINSNLPALKLATTTYRPGQATTLLVVENVSKNDLFVDRIRFRPGSRFPVGTPKDTASNLRSITFLPEDNTATDPSLHGTYDHRPTKPIRIAAGEKVSMRFLIQDATHDGWGFDGRMVLNYQESNGNRKMLVADSAKVSFVK